ncbi:MAG: hypothetical protein L0Y64_22620 [Myxococcaceae bacterium]|nr:hypothetical protein [Myxococcaceae bacterium]
MRALLSPAPAPSTGMHPQGSRVGAAPAPVHAAGAGFLSRVALTVLRPLGAPLSPGNHFPRTEVLSAQPVLAPRVPKCTPRPGSLAHRVVSLTLERPDLTCQQLADATGAKLETVYTTLHRAGLHAAQAPRQPPPLKKVGQGRTLTPEQEAEVCRRRAAASRTRPSARPWASLGRSLGPW